MSEMPDYDGSLERRSGRSHAQPNGVSEGDTDWNHRTEMADQGSVQFEEQRSISQIVNARRAGKVASDAKKDHGKCGGRSSNDNDDALVDGGKSTKEKYADKYGGGE